MADITIDSAVNNSLDNLTQPRSLVWTDKDTGYIFFVDDGFDLHFRKTTDAGANWSTETTVRTGTITKFVIWYDKWTKGDSGDIIHIAFVDNGDDDITYNSFSTSDDTLDGEVTVFAGASGGGTTTWPNSCISIVKSVGGNIYVGGWIDPDGENDFARATQSPATSFSSRTSMADGNAVDRIMFLPGSETDTNDIWCLYDDVSANSITLKVYDDSANSWSESSSIDTIMETSTLFGWDVMERHSDEHAILVLWNANQSNGGDIAVHDITDINTFSAKTDVVTNVNAFAVCGMLINQQNDDIYVAYNTATITGQIVYQLSTDGGGAWDGETAMSVTSDDHKLVIGGTSVGDDGGRWMPAWFNDDLNDILCNADNSIEIAAAAAAPTGGNSQMMAANF